MNEKTAAHYNHLLAMSQPITISITKDEDGDRNIALADPLNEGDRQAIEKAIYAAVPQAIADELQEAAQERRKADTRIEQRDLLGQSWLYPTTIRAYLLAEPEILAYLSRVMQDRTREYEVYRRACEQRIALPPENLS